MRRRDSRGAWASYLEPQEHGDYDGYDANYERRLREAADLERRRDAEEAETDEQYLERVRESSADLSLEELRGKRCGLVDAGSVALLHKFGEQLHEPVDAAAASLLRTHGRYDEELRQCFEVLERLIVYDFVVVDSVAISQRASDFHFGCEVLQTVAITPSVYRDIGALAQQLIQRGAKAAFDKLAGAESADDEYQERIEGLAPRLLSYSNESIVRGLLYLETARRAELPLLLHPKKREWLKTIAGAHRDAYWDVRSLADGAVREGIQTALQDHSALAVDLPSLSSYVVRFAERRNLSVLDALKIVKASPEAESFRAWLWALQTKLLRGTAADLIAAAKQVDEVKQIAARWAERLDTDCGVRYRHRTFKLEAIPAIGWLFKAAGAGEVTLKDPILTPKRYLTFVADWYRLDIESE